MPVFSLTSQVLGDEHAVSAESRGRGIAVISEEGATPARNVNEATRIVARILGPGLEDAGRKGLPWGLHVEVAGKQAVYGEWPLLSVPGPRDLQPSPLSKIRAQWKQGDSPLEALDNAIRIIHAFAEHHRRAAA